MAIAGLINLEAFRRYYRLDRTEFFIAMLVLLGVRGFGLLKGVLFGAIISLLILISRKALVLDISVLGKLSGTESFASMKHHPKSEEISEVLALRVHGSLLDDNVEEVKRKIMGLGC